MRAFAKYFPVVLAIVLLATSCKKDGYKNDGGTHNPNVNMTTYDFLASHPSFDSLVKAIDMAGLKDVVNSDITFFATTNWGVRDYMLAKKQRKIIELGNENIQFYMKDLNAQVLKDSLKMYMFNGKVTRENLNTKGAYYESLFGSMASDVKIYIKLRRTQDYSGYLDYVDYINFTKVIGTLDTDEPNISAIPAAQRDKAFDCQTTGIITTTGVLHVLRNEHRLFFNEEPMAGN